MAPELSVSSDGVPSKRPRTASGGAVDAEGGTRFGLCVCDVYSPWGCMVPAIIFSLIGGADREGVYDRLRCFVWKT